MCKVWSELEAIQSRLQSIGQPVLSRGGCNRVYTPQATQPYCCNKRQLMKRLYPKYSFHLIDFTCPLS